MSETKKCPACAEDIKKEAKKCRFCGEVLEERENIQEKKKIFKEYKKWLFEVSPTQEIIDENYDDLILTVERKFKSFNGLIFFILLLLWILPGIIYAIATLQEKSIKTMIYFGEDGEVLRLSNQKSTYLMWKYNKHIGKENMKIVQKTQE